MFFHCQFKIQETLKGQIFLQFGLGQTILWYDIVKNRVQLPWYCNFETYIFHFDRASEINVENICGAVTESAFYVEYQLGCNLIQYCQALFDGKGTVYRRHSAHCSAVFSALCAYSYLH